MSKKINSVKKKATPKTSISFKKIPTGIPGFEDISFGGLPLGRSTLISGSAGSGKTIFACQFLVEGIRKYGEAGVFISFEERIDDLRSNVGSFGWNITQYEKQKLWRFIDASVSYETNTRVIGDYNLEPLIQRIDAVINEIGAKRVVFDSIGSLFQQFTDPALIRRELLKIIAFLKKKKIVVIITSERLEEYGLVSRFGVEEYITDNVIILRNALENEKRRRTIEILKYRGSIHSAGEQSFVIDANMGVVIIPLTRLQLTQRSRNIRVTSGNSQLDTMSHGGVFKDSVILVSGATGTGKTLMVTSFLKGGFENNEKMIFLAYEESREQLMRNAEGWGVDFKKMEKQGNLQIHAVYPETASLEEHLLKIQKLLEKFKPTRFALDSLSAIERGSSKKNFREFLIALTSFLKRNEITAIFTSTSTSIIGGTSVTDSPVVTQIDIIKLIDNGQYTAIFINKKTEEVVSMEASQIKF